MKRQEPKLPSTLAQSVDLYAAVLVARRDEAAVRETHFIDCAPEPLTESGMDFAFCIFEGCRLAGWALPKAYFSDVIFRRCDLSNCKLTEATLRRVVLEDCKLMGADWNEALLEDVRLTRCAARYLNLSRAKVKTVQFEECDFSGAVLQEMNLRGVSLGQCRLEGAELLHTPLKGLDFRDSEIGGIRVEGPELRGAVVSPAQACELAALWGLVVK